MFVAHWVNNAFSGAALEGGAKGIFINILNRFQTGSYFKTGACPGQGQGVAVQTLQPERARGAVGVLPGGEGARRSRGCRRIPRACSATRAG